MRKENDPYSEFGYYIHRVVMLLDKRGEELFRTELGISLRQFLLLRLIEADAKHAPSQQLITDRLGIAKSAVSRHIDIAREKGWIEVSTSETSRRQNSLSLTKEGKALLTKAKALIEQSENEGFGDVPEADVEATLRVLQSLYKKLLASY
ncbi:MAG TPA: MarR family winged helix-turn-helix transcriptional regulator [Candidatus Saccharimonadales bacterium]|jgi:DNA-binding MarR family transcriptional regulator